METFIDFSGFIRPNGHNLFLSFEGIEGSGKSTQIKKLSEYLVQQGYAVSVFREPGATAWGEQLREVMLSQKSEVDPLSQCLLFLSARNQLITEKILPLLASSQKTVVIVDRYIDSTIAYQGFAGKLSIESILQIHRVGALCHIPHKTFYLKIDLATSRQRQIGRGGKADFFESKPDEYYLNLCRGYDQVAKSCPDRVITINGLQAEQSVTQDIISAAAKFIGLKS